MTNLHFENAEDFANIFKRKSKNVTDVIVKGIELAISENKKSANLFSITFEDATTMFEISLPKSQWRVALESCLDHYHDLSLADEQIDTWKLLEIIKTYD